MIILIILFIYVIYPFEKKFKIFEQVILLNISAQFFITNHITFVKLFSANLRYEDLLSCKRSRSELFQEKKSLYLHKKCCILLTRLFQISRFHAFCPYTMLSAGLRLIHSAHG